MTLSPTSEIIRPESVRPFASRALAAAPAPPERDLEADLDVDRAPATEEPVRSRPALRVVPRRVRRRRAGLAVAGLCVVLFAVLAGLTSFQTMIARRQMSLDGTSARLAAAVELQDRLRLEVARRESPEHVIGRARTELGMEVTDPTQVATVSPSAEQVAEVTALAHGTAPLAAEATPVVAVPADPNALAG